MKIPFTWKPTGWYMIGWSIEFPVAQVRPLRYFGEDLVAYRDERRRAPRPRRPLSLISAPTSGTEGACAATASSARSTAGVGDPTVATGTSPMRTIRTGPRRSGSGPSVSSTVVSSCGSSPRAKRPVGSCPTSSEPFRTSPRTRTAYYRPYPELSTRYEREPVHPQVPAENAPDSVHFQYVHRATVTPKLLNWEIVDQEWRFLTGWPDAGSDEPGAMALRIHSILFGLGGAISAFEGSSNYRLVFATTPVEDGCSDMFYSIWWPRRPGTTRTCLRPDISGARREGVPGDARGRPGDLAVPGLRRTPGPGQTGCTDRTARCAGGPGSSMRSGRSASESVAMSGSDAVELSLTPEEVQLVDAVRSLLRRESSPDRIRASEKTGFDPSLWTDLQQLGVPSMAVGDGHTEAARLFQLALVAEQCGAALASAPVLEGIVAARLLARCRDDAVNCWRRCARAI